MKVNLIRIDAFGADRPGALPPDPRDISTTKMDMGVAAP
jgi:hypothetical protein